MSSLVWFRSDLRMHDNRALAEACASDAQVVGLFLVCAEQWREHHWGPRKQAFVWRHALALRQALAARGIPLWIRLAPRFADAPATLAGFAAEHRVVAVYANAEYGVNEARRDRHVTATLARSNIDWHCRHDLSLLPPGSLLTATGTGFRVFGAFRRALLGRVREQHAVCQPLPPARAAVTPPALPEWPAPELDVDDEWWPIGEAAAQRRLNGFIEERVDNYHVDRDIPCCHGTSRLSPYLAAGVISIRRCVDAALAYNRGEWDSGSAGACAWLNELIWREFTIHVLHNFPQVSRNLPFRSESRGIRWREPGADFARWCNGQTGFPLVDAAMRQLHQTGWMHNRLRMLCAMFLSKYLLLDWRLGERHFMQQLIDGDLAANNGGWQWSASTGTDAAPYFRILSPLRQAERFDADGSFMRRYLPELAEVAQHALFTPGHPDLLAAGYPLPMVDLKFARQRAIAAWRSLQSARE